MTPIVSRATFPAQKDEFTVNPQFFHQRALAEGGIDENSVRGLSLWARYAAGFTVVEITVGEDRFYGRSICSLQDRWDSNIGTVRALSAALDDAYASGSELGKAWALYLGRRSPSRVARLLAILEEVEEVAA